MWLLSAPFTWWHKTTIKKIGTEGLKGPYILLCNHNSFFDFQVVTKAFLPQCANYIVAVDGFIRGIKWLMLQVGCVPK